jgi:uncharacterized protein YciI
MNIRANLLAGLWVVVLAVCSPGAFAQSKANTPEQSVPAASKAASAAQDIPPGMKQYFVALLLSGPNRNQSPEESDKLTAGHRAYIHQQGTAGKYVLAGPFTDDGRIRGIIVVAVASAQEASDIVGHDPAVLAGRLAVEIHPALLPSLEGVVKY